MDRTYFFSLDEIEPQIRDPGGSITSATADHVSGFENISFSSLRLKKGGALEPLWHPNAHKIGYCLEGKALVKVRGPGHTDGFTVEKGDMFFIPKGYIHHVANLGDQEVHIPFAFSHVLPEWMRLSKALDSLSEEVFNATFSTPAGYLEGLKKGGGALIHVPSPSTNVAATAPASRLKFNIGASPKVIQTRGGYLQNGTKANLPVLEGLGLLGFGLKPKGIVEPHWHTNAGELVYIVRGKTRITLLSPDMEPQVFEVGVGQGVFAPASHFHNIENTGSEDVEVIAFFSHAQPDYIGFGEAVGSCSDEILASVFNVPSNSFDRMDKPQGPLVIVPV
jgi:oxalate decarboxylase